MNDQTPIAAIGHNTPPPPTPEEIRANLEIEHAGLIERRNSLVAATGRAPAAIDDEETSGKVADFIRQITATIKDADAKRVGAKEPYLAGGKAVDAFFKGVSDPLDKAKASMAQRLTAYQRKKADDERRRLEAEAEKRRLEAEAREREAAERERAIHDDRALADAIVAAELAKNAKTDAVKAEVAASAKPAELSRTRGDYGAVASLRTVWTFDPASVDRASIDLEALRPHLPADGIEKAIRSFIRAGGRSLRGVQILETSETVVR